MIPAPPLPFLPETVEGVAKFHLLHPPRPGPPPVLTVYTTSRPTPPRTGASAAGSPPYPTCAAAAARTGARCPQPPRDLPRPPLLPSPLAPTPFSHALKSTARIVGPPPGRPLRSFLTAACNSASNRVPSSGGGGVLRCTGWDPPKGSIVHTAPPAPWSGWPWSAGRT